MITTNPESGQGGTRPEDASFLTDDQLRMLKERLDSADMTDLVNVYLNEATVTPRLEPEEEAHYMKTMIAGRRFRRIDTPHVDKREKQFRIVPEFFTNEAQYAYDILIRSNLRLVIHVAKDYIGRGIDFEDLIQYGNEGLIHAVNVYEPDRGARLSTCAVEWIKQSLFRATADQGRTVQLPEYLTIGISQMRRAESAMLNRLGRNPTEGELAQALDIDVSGVRNMKMADEGVLYLDGTMDEEEKTVLGDFVADEEALFPEGAAAKIILQEQIEKTLKSLLPQEERILRLRLGLNGTPPLTIREVAKKMLISRRKVGDVTARALSRLKDPKVKQLLEDYLED